MKALNEKKIQKLMKSYKKTRDEILGMQQALNNYYSNGISERGPRKTITISI